MRQPRVGEQAGNLIRKPSEDDLFPATSPLYPNLPLEDYGEIVQRLTLPAHDLSRLKLQFLKMFRQPCELFVGQIREDLDLAQIID
jgi:hypothetical protein